ncbi:hypothetical protein NDI41_13255 [Leptolyngbya sp. NM2-A1]
MKLPPECWRFARFAGKAPTFWVNSYAETSLVLSSVDLLMFRDGRYHTPLISKRRQIYAP